jgi:hypothetical protein
MQDTINGITIKATLSNTKQPKWSMGGKHNHYRVRISKGRNSVTFDYFDSIYNTQNNKEADMKDILFCFASDVSNGGEEFDDSMMTRKQYGECKRMANAAERMGISEETLVEWWSL